MNSSVQSLSHSVLVTPWTAACQASLSITNSQSLLKLMSIESVMPSNHLILCCSLLLLPSIFPSIRVFSNESVLHIRWPKYWSFSFSISPTNEYSLIIFQNLFAWSIELKFPYLININLSSWFGFWVHGHSVLRTNCSGYSREGFDSTFKCVSLCSLLPK